MTEIDVRRAGDRAVLLELADNAAAVRIARLLRAECHGVVDVVGGHRTVLATWDAEPPGAALLEIAERALSTEDEHRELSTRLVEIPVVYDGPDLALVAELAGLSPEEVAVRHARAEYTVAFVGFAPGFAYLLGSDERLRVPRLDEPRQRVPAGSVAVAGPYSGIYPREGPGGWRLLGRTTAVLFDVSRRPPAMLAPGDRVRVVAA